MNILDGAAGVASSESCRGWSEKEESHAQGRDAAASKNIGGLILVTISAAVAYMNWSDECALSKPLMSAL